MQSSNFERALRPLKTSASGRWRPPSIRKDAKAVIFDLDGTLVDTLPDMMAALNTSLARHGHPPAPIKQVLSQLHGGLEAMVCAALAVDHIGKGDARQVLGLFEDLYLEDIASRSMVYPGVIGLLDVLRQEGVRLGVCTNKPEAMAKTLLAGLDIDGCFEVVVGADTCATRKPSPEPLLHALSILGALGQEAWMVGDSMVDVACARAASVSCAIYAAGYGMLPASEDGSYRLFNQYDELSSLIRGPR